MGLTALDWGFTALFASPDSAFTLESNARSPVESLRETVWQRLT